LLCALRARNTAVPQEEEQLSVRLPGTRNRAIAIILTVLAAAGCGIQPAPPSALTAAQMTAAQAAAGRFTALYGTRAYRQSAGAWLARLARLDTPGLQGRLAAAPGRLAEPVTLTSRATVTAARAIAATSVTFLVRTVTTITTRTSGATTDQYYAVTVTRAAGAWKASGISPVPPGSAASAPLPAATRPAMTRPGRHPAVRRAPCTRSSAGDRN
jgi:hypothetical protein